MVSMDHGLWEMQLMNVGIILMMLIASALAVEQSAGAQIDTAPIEEPPLPRPDRRCMTLPVIVLRC